MWKYDDIIFDSVVRRSGGSLVITIPPELKRRFLLNEGQPVRLIGVVRKGLYVEGGILIYFGRFEIVEKATKVIMTIKKSTSAQISEDDIKNLTKLFDKYNLSNYSISRIDKSTLKIELIISSISEEGIVYITREDIEKIFYEIRKSGYTIEEIKEESEELTWHGIDPSILVRYTSELPENIKTKWILK